MKKLTDEQLQNISKSILDDCIECGADENKIKIFNAVLLMIATFLMRYQEELDQE